MASARVRGWTLPVRSMFAIGNHRFGGTTCTNRLLRLRVPRAWSGRACSNQCKRRLFRLRGRSGHSRRRRRGRNRWERDSEQSSASTTGLLSAPTPRLSSASARSGLSASAGLCSAGTRLSLGTRARLGRRLRLSAAHRTGVPIIGPYYR
jgi:hypothetical protein